MDERTINRAYTIDGQRVYVRTISANTLSIRCETGAGGAEVKMDAYHWIMMEPQQQQRILREVAATASTANIRPFRRKK